MEQKKTNCKEIKFHKCGSFFCKKKMKRREKLTEHILTYATNDTVRSLQEGIEKYEIKMI